MSKTATIRTQVEPEFKAEVESVLKKLGLSVAEAIDQFLHQVRDLKMLPFEQKRPNRLTLETLRKSEANEDVIYFADVDDMVEKLRQ